MLATSNSNAQYLTALLASDLTTLIHWLDIAIEAGNTKAMIMRAIAYTEDSSTEVTKADKAAGFDLLEKAINLGDPEAMFLHAQLNISRAKYKYGKNNVDKFHRVLKEELILLERAAQLENLQAMLELAKLHSETGSGIFNLAKSIWLYERAKRYGYTDPEPELELKHNSIGNKETAQDLLELIWDELLAGQAFSAPTLSCLSTYCKDTVIERLKDEPQGSSIHFLKALRNNPNHPLCLILNDGKEFLILKNGKTDQMSQELKTLMQHASSVVNTRITFFQLFRSPDLNHIPAEVSTRILSLVHAGAHMDEEQNETSSLNSSPN